MTSNSSIVWFKRCFLPCCLLCLLSVGCGANPVNRANYDRVKSGMTEADIDRILGKGKEISADEMEQALQKMASPDGAGKLPKADGDLRNLRAMRWGADKKYIVIVFRDGRVYKVDQQGL